MIANIFNHLLIFIFLFLILCLEKVIGLPLAFLSLMGFWFGGSYEEKKSGLFFGERSFYFKKMAGLIYGTLVLAIIYNLMFFLAAVVICLCYYSYFLVKRVIISKKWRWLIVGMIGALVVGFVSDYSFNAMIFFQLIFSSLLYWVVRIFVKK